MANVIYDNFYLSNEVEDQYNSHLNLQQFCTVDNSLTGTAGMIRKINRYRASDGTEKLTMGQGNTKSIEVRYSPYEYKIQMAQNRFDYYDEQEMTDPMLVPVGVRHMGTDMFNTVNKDIFAEYNKASRVLLVASLGFDAFADSQAMFNLENIENVNFFAFVHPADVAALRKALGTSLQYVESFARNGYIGTVAGTNLYTKKDATRHIICTATKDAVTLFNKKGTEVEIPKRSADEANTRKNSIFSRKYYLAALTHDQYAVRIIKGTAAVSTDTTVTAGKLYYIQSGLGYEVVEPVEGDSPKTKGWYEITVG